MMRRGAARRIVTRDNEDDRRIVDRLLQDLPYADIPAPRPPPLRRRVARPHPLPRTQVHRSRDQQRAESKGGTWARLAIGILLGASMVYWPYTHDCGLPLGAYLFAVCVVLLAGAWVGTHSWKRRLPMAHVFALGLLGWGVLLATDQVLRRTGYARAQMTWTCTAK